MNILFKRKTRDTKSDSCTSSVHVYLGNDKASHAHLVCMNTLEKHIAMLSLFDPYIRRREICIRLLIIFVRIDQSNIFVGFMKLSSKF